MCLTPFGVKTKEQGMVNVPCGRCPLCVKRRVSAWSFRLMQEEKQSSSAIFVTLTYDTKNAIRTLKGFMTINKRHVQLFYKRLRKAHEKKQRQSIKYYTVGEYGGKTLRPHYHAIIFNSDVGKIQGAWGLGQIHYGTVTGASVGYCLKYMAKPGRIPLHKNDDRQPEFGLMSKGLGKSYLSQNMVQWHKNSIEDRMYCVLKDGRKISMPRYYKDKIYESWERKLAASTQLNKIREEEEKRIKEGGETYYRDKAQRDIAAFKKMHFNNQKDQKL